MEIELHATTKLRWVKRETDIGTLLILQQWHQKKYWEGYECEWRPVEGGEWRDIPTEEK